jgi:uncharacterized membrane protein YkvA (DUF1232 family)
MKNLKDYIYESYENDCIYESKIEDIVSGFIKSDFIDKIKSIAKDLGKKTLTKIFSLYYALSDPSISQKDKVFIVSSLIYLITPVDLISDFLPNGCTDDLSLITFVYLTIKKNITKDIEKKAENQVEKLFN